MNYGEWSKSIELDRTFTPNLTLRYYGINIEKILEQKETKATKLRIEAEFRQAFSCCLF